MDLNSPPESSRSSRAGIFFQFFSDDSNPSLQNIRENEYEATLASMSLDDILVLDSSTNLSDQILPMTTTPTPLVKPLLVGNFSQTLRISDPSKSLFLFVADNMVFAMSLSLQFPLSLCYSIMAIVSNRALPFAHNSGESSSSRSTSPSLANLASHRMLSLLLWDARHQPMSRLPGHLLMLLKIYQPSCFAVFISDPRFGDEVAKGFGIRSYSVFRGSGSIPTILFLWSETCFFSVNHVNADSISLSAYVSLRSTPFEIPLRQGRGAIQSSVNRCWLHISYFASHDRSKTALGGSLGYLRQKESFFQKLPASRISSYAIPENLWSIVQRGLFSLMDVFSKAQTPDPWLNFKPYTLSIAAVSDGAFKSRGGFIIRNAQENWRAGFCSKFKGSGLSLFVLSLLQQGLKRARTMQVGCLEVIVDVSICNMALANMDTSLMKTEVVLCDILQMMHSRSWEISVRHLTQEDIKGASLLAKYSQRFNWDHHEEFDLPPSTAILLGPY